TSLSSGGVGRGYAHSRAGALAANANYQQSFADTAILRPEELRRRIEAAATEEYAPAMLAANEPGADRLTRGGLGKGLRAGLPTSYFAVPAFHRVLAYSSRRAVIRTWGFTIVGNSSTVEPTAYFGTSRMELRWADGDWKIADTQAAFGPTPRVLSPRRGGEGFEVVDLVEGMRPYAATP
ncbi:MAG TPA: hypothetical protein VGV69_00845, partial [Solirubrobacterales bacterium]|nr:hypothetical protein [Solirubrobacterales bacterium]